MTEKLIFLNDIKSIQQLIKNSDKLDHTDSSSLSKAKKKPISKTQQFAAKISLTSLRNINSSNEIAPPDQFKKSAFAPRVVHQGYSGWEEQVKLSDAKNFLPQNNQYSSTELLFNSGVLRPKSYFDSTKASLLYSKNYSLNEPSQFLQKKDAQALHAELQEILEQQQRKELQLAKQNDPFYSFVPPPPMEPRRASLIVEESLTYIDNLRKQQKLDEKTVVFSPYQITNQDDLLKLIEIERIHQESTKDYHQRNLREESTNNANDILKYLGMPSYQESRKEVDDDEENETYSTQEDEQLKGKKETDASVKRDMTRKKSRKQTTNIGDLLIAMNSKTPAEQKVEILHSARNEKSGKNAKATFQDAEQEVDKRKILLISEGIKRQIETDKKMEEEALINAAYLKANKNKINELNEAAHRIKINQVLDRKNLKKSFKFASRYDSNIIAKAFEKKDKKYVCKYLSQVNFDYLDEQEVDQDLSVVATANYGQQVLFIESNEEQKQKQKPLKSLLIPRGKFRDPIFVEEDAAEEDILDAHHINRRTRRQIQSLAMESCPNISSKKENNLSLYGRQKKAALEILPSEWETKMIEMGKRKVRFEKTVDLKQFQQEDQQGSIFRDPTLFTFHKPERSEDDTGTLGEQPHSFMEQESPLPKWHALDNKSRDNNKLEDIFDEAFYGGDEKDSVFQREQKRFKQFKAYYKVEFDRLDGFVHKFKQKDAIEKSVRQNDTYQEMIKEPGEKAWRPFDQPQSNPPDILKEFLIEPNILVYCKNILDIDMNYKMDKEKDNRDLVGARRQGKVGLVEENVVGSQLQNIAENKGTVIPSEDNKAQEQKYPGAEQIKAMSMAEQIMLFQQMKDDNEQKTGPNRVKREYFDFMFANPASLPYAPMQKITRYVEEAKYQVPKLNEADQAVYDATPMISENIFTNKCFFSIKEAQEYEKEIRLRNIMAHQPTDAEIKKKQLEQALNKERGQLQMNNMMAAMNPINYQFIKKDVKGRTMLQGIEQQIEKEITKQKIQQPQKKEELPVSTDQKKKGKDITETDDSTSGKVKQRVITEDPDEDEKVDQSKGKTAEAQIYADMMEIKTIQELNAIQSNTSDAILSRVQNKIKMSTAQLGNVNDFQGEYIGYSNQMVKEDEQSPQKKKTNNINLKVPLNKLQLANESENQIKKSGSIPPTASDQNIPSGSRGSEGNTSVQSNEVRNRRVVKDKYDEDYGSYLKNVQMDYLTPQYYHYREAEQGLFYLSKNYRDYFEPARDVFAEKEGWDILDHFAKNPKNTNAVKPSVHNYGETNQKYTEDDILTAFHGLNTMNEYNQLIEDVDKRNEQNLRRRIYFNQ